MALEEIERLREKIEKDPTSKLFVPLAEEYKKAGMYDEAIAALIQGLEKQPAYLSARVSLGKIYIERAMLTEARSEFEKVIAAIPENLYAHKKLAEIYRDLGERDKAAHEFKTVLKLNPMDEWAAASLSSLELEPKPAMQKQEETSGEIAPAGEAFPPAEQEELAMQEGFKPDEVPLTGRDLEIPVSHAAEQGEIPAEIPVSSEDEELLKTYYQATEHVSETEEIPSGASLNPEEADLWQSHLDTMKDLREEAEETPALTLEEDMQLWQSHAETLREKEQPLTELAEAEESAPEESISFEDIFKQQDSATEDTIGTPEEKPVVLEAGLNLSDADQSIARGEYLEAMTIYRNILANDPGNRQILQRMEELKALLKLLGKDKEALVIKLESFLEGIKKRRDGFFGST
jgi:tetratricopeptide (TPR) repeat protein